MRVPTPRPIARWSRWSVFRAPAGRGFPGSGANRRKPGDSTAMVSPGCATARRARLSASMQPCVTVMSSAASTMPLSSARRANADRNAWLPPGGVARTSMSGCRRMARIAAWRNCSAGYKDGAARAPDRFTLTGLVRPCAMNSDTRAWMPTYCAGSGVSDRFGSSSGRMRARFGWLTK